MTSEQNKAIRAVLAAVDSALRFGVTKEQILHAVERFDNAGTTPRHRQKQARVKAVG